jgi:hypothetical protein
MSNLGEFFGGQGFNPDDVKSDVLPAGTYRAVMTGTEIKTSKAGHKYMAATLEIVAPPEFAGRKLWDNLNLGHPTPSTRQIAERRLKAYCAAVGAGVVMDTSTLFNKVMLITITADQQGDEIRNQVKKVEKYLKTGEAATTAPTSAPAATSANADPF